jgi:hypothetical protein
MTVRSGARAMWNALRHDKALTRREFDASIFQINDEVPFKSSATLRALSAPLR